MDLQICLLGARVRCVYLRQDTDLHCAKWVCGGLWVSVRLVVLSPNGCIASVLVLIVVYLLIFNGLVYK